MRLNGKKCWKFNRTAVRRSDYNLAKKFEMWYFGIEICSKYDTFKKYEKKDLSNGVNERPSLFLS
jgi:hypothetical protein